MLAKPQHNQYQKYASLLRPYGWIRINIGMHACMYKPLLFLRAACCIGAARQVDTLASWVQARLQWMDAALKHVAETGGMGVTPNWPRSKTNALTPGASVAALPSTPMASVLASAWASGGGRAGTGAGVGVGQSAAGAAMPVAERGPSILKAGMMFMG